MNRGNFVRSGAAAVAAVTFLKNVALSSEAASYASVMTPLIETILPTDTQAIPNVQAISIASRISSIYGLGDNAAFLASLNAFSDVPSFAVGSLQLVQAELATMSAVNTRKLLGKDSSALRASGLGAPSTFESLSAGNRRLYLRLWERSAFNTRRRFYGSVRAVTFATFYSMPESWRAIGYAGPLLKTAGPG